MNQAILITGGTKGIGLAIARHMLAKQYFVYLNYAHDENAAYTASELLCKEGYADHFSLLKADISVGSQRSQMIERVLADGRPLKGLILNAASNGKVRHSFFDVTSEELYDMFETNLFSSFFLIQGFARNMAEEGRVIVISSAMGIYPHSTYLPYGLTKAAEIALVQMLVKELNTRRITINAVAPHCIETEMFPGKRPEAQLESMKNKIAVRRFGKTEEVASAVDLLIENGFINGEVLMVDGGYDFA